VSTQHLEWDFEWDLIKYSRIWSVSCDGELSAGIIGVTAFQFGRAGDADTALFAQDAVTALQKRDVVSFIKYVGPKLNFASRLFSFAKRLLEIRTALGIDQLRCDNPAFKPVERFGARAANANGCGSQGAIWDYPPFVTDRCCIDHDFCFGKRELNCINETED
jgi:hypothetical protein